MEHYDFDKIIDRQGSCSIKYDALDQWFGCTDVTPMWVADMDFESCPVVTEALRQRLCHPVLGYTTVPDSYWDAIIGWLSRRHGLKATREQLRFIPGVVKGIALVVNYFTNRGDKVLIQPPVYHPFRHVVEGNQRQVVCNPLIERDGKWAMDLDGLRRVVEAEHPRMMILCNPHNPIGLQWDAETLREVAHIAAENNMIVVSDEIHADLMLNRRPHTPFIAVSQEAANVGVTLGAPSKTFNIPGMASSWCLIPNPTLRDEFFNWLDINEFCAPDMGAIIAAQSAYNNGEAWLDQLLSYIEGNIETALDYIATNCRGLKGIPPEASFLIWLDCRSLGMSQEQLVDFFLHKAHLALNDGSIFGPEGVGFMRLNVGMPRAKLTAALQQLSTALQSL